MKLSECNKLKKQDYIVLVPEGDEDILESIKYSFKNVFFIDYAPTKEEINNVIEYINTKVNQLILFDYKECYRNILPHIRKNKQIKWIYKNNIASMTDPNIKAVISNILEFYDRDIVNTIGCLEYDTYKVLEHNGYNAKYLTLDIERQNKSNSKKSNSIGIISNDFNPNHNFYNELSALKMVDYSEVKLVSSMPATLHFIEFFNIKGNLKNDKEEVLKDNYVNLYCNFTGNNMELILKSIDNEVPCLLGNTSIFDKNPILKEYLVLKSDDDINEISDKIKKIKENRDKIVKELSKFRSEYSNNSRKQIKEYLNNV